MDVLMLLQSGIENVVASSGTSLSENHANLLKRFAPEVIIVYDGDASGFQAAQRGLHRLLAEGLRVRIALLPTGEDPDSFTRQHGARCVHSTYGQSDKSHRISDSSRHSAAGHSPGGCESKCG